MKKVFILLMAVLLVLSSSVPVWAEISNKDISNDEVENGEVTDEYVDTIYQYINAINQHDFQKVSQLVPSSEREMISKIYANEENIQNKIGFLNVKSTEIVFLQEISEELYGPGTDIDVYEDIYGDSIRGYLLGESCTVYNEDKYKYNGINFSIVLLANESGDIKIIENSAVPQRVFDLLPQQLDAEADSDMVKSLERAKNVVMARRAGLIINEEGTILDVNVDADEETLASLEAMVGNNIANMPTDIDINYPHYKPAKIRVLLDNGSVDSLDFDYYLANVLPNEWYTTWPMESLKAGAICVKMVGWYRVESPKYSGYDITASSSADQKYRPGSANVNTSNALKSLSNTGVMCKLSQGGYLFYPSYANGTAGSKGKKGGGQLSQEGTKVFANEGTSYFPMLEYYYNGSSKTYGNDIETFTYYG